MRRFFPAFLCVLSWAAPVAALPPVSTPLNALAVSATTGEKPQSKVWTHDGRWWCVLPNGSGTWVWRLDGATWTNVLQLSTSTQVHADVKASGAVTHVLLFSGASTELASIEYVAASHTYQAWAARPANAPIALDAGTETATIDVDSQGRMWLATDRAAGTDQVVAYYSDSPYASWSGPVTLATGISGDDIAVVTALPSGKIGVLWSNQATRRFGFRTHADGDDPGVWTADEVPASQSALEVGLGMADDHLHVAVASDGTLYAAVKTSYDTPGYPKMAMLVRRPAGTWDDLYGLGDTGTRGIVLLDEGAGTVTVVYTSQEGAGDILYKESATSAISFGGSTVLMPGGLNDAMSTKANLSGSVVILAGTGSSVSGVLRTASVPPAGPVGWWKMDGDPSDASGNGNHATAFGNPAYVTGMNGQAVSLNGTSQYASVADNASLGTVTSANAITLAAWVKPGVVNTQNLISKSTNGGVNGYELCLASATSGAGPNRAFVRFNQVTSGDTYRVNSNTLYSGLLGTWIHLAATYDGAVIKLYMNGVLENSLAATIGIAANTLPLAIGAQVAASGTASRWFQGAMDDVRLYNRALSASEIADLMNLTTFTITASAGPHGSISPSGAVSVPQGGSQTFTITPEVGYIIADVLVDGGSVGAVASYQFTNVTAPHTIAASFLQCSYVIAASAAPGGAISPAGEVTVACGASQTFTITPDPNHLVEDLWVNGSSVGAVSSYTFTNVQAAATISATFVYDDPVSHRVAHWAMEEGSGGVILDATAHHLDGAVAGEPGWVAGKYGQALALNGTSQYALVPHDARLDVSQITLAAWIRPAKLGTANVIAKANFVSPLTPGYELNLSTTGKPFVRFNASDSYRVNGATSYPTDGNTWMHLAATYDGAVIRLYVDGALDGSLTSAFAISANTLPLGIGAQSDGNAARLFQGALDEVQIYDRALSAATIAALASAVVGVERPLPESTRLSSARPNPFGGATTLELGLPSAGPLSLVVFGVDGRKVRTLASGRWEAGVHRLTWDGRDDGGRRVPAGIYFVQLTTAQGRFVRRITSLR